MKEENIDGFLFCMFVIVLLCVSIVGYSLIIMESEEYILFCINERGEEINIKFRGLDKNDIDVIEICRKYMFNPVDSYTVPIID